MWVQLYVSSILGVGKAHKNWSMDNKYLWLKQMWRSHLIDGSCVTIGLCVCVYYFYESVLLQTSPQQFKNFKQTGKGAFS